MTSTIGVEKVYSVGTINNVETSYVTQLAYCNSIRVFDCYIG